MLSLVRHWVMMPVFAAGATAVAVVTGTQPGPRDGIGDLIKRTDTGTQVVQAQASRPPQPPPATASRRAGSCRPGAAGRPRRRRQQRAGAAPDEGGRCPPAGRRQEPRRSAQAADGKRLHRAADLDGDARGSRAQDSRPARFRARRRHRRAGRRPAEENRRPAQEHPRARRPHRPPAREAARRAEGRHAAGLRHRHGRQPRQGHRRDQEAHRSQPRRDRQDQDRGAGGAQEGRHAALARAGRPAARQRALGRPRAPGGGVQLGQDDRRPARQADDRVGREHRRGAQVFRHARGPVRAAGALAGPADRPRSTSSTCPSCPRSRSTSARRAPRRRNC